MVSVRLVACGARLRTVLVAFHGGLDTDIKQDHSSASIARKFPASMKVIKATAVATVPTTTVNPGPSAVSQVTRERRTLEVRQGGMEGRPEDTERGCLNIWELAARNRLVTDQI